MFDEPERRPKSGVGWRVMLSWDDFEFARHFRMSRTAFDNLLLLLWPDCGRDVIYNETKQKKLLMFLWYMSNQNSFREIGDKFDSAESHDSILSVLDRISSIANKFIKWPNLQERTRSAVHFRNRSHIENVIGAIDGCHIRIQKPSGPHSDSYLNRHRYHSLLLQGVCDHVGRFIDVFIGMPGCVHDARMLRRSSLFLDLENHMDGFRLLGDSAYIAGDFQHFISTPIRDNGRLTPLDRQNNSLLSSGRVIIENAFGRLKCKFRRLRDLQNTRMDVCVLLAGCVLHNFCINQDMDETCPEHGTTCPRDVDDNDIDDADICIP
jgi:hypothetical protein